jgi:hypothetical protein
MKKRFPAFILLVLLAGCSAQTGRDTYTMPKGSMGSAEHQMVQPETLTKPEATKDDEKAVHMPKGGMSSVGHEMSH